MHNSRGSKPLTPTTQPSDKMTPPNTKLVSPNNYKKVHVTRIVKRLRGNKYAKYAKRRQGVPPERQHYTCARTHSFLPQSIMKMDDKGYQEHIANNIYHQETGARQTMNKLLVGKNSHIWNNSFSNEFGRLAQDIGKQRPTEQYLNYTNTIFFVPRNKVPQEAKVTYKNLICDLRPLKSDTEYV